MPLQDVQKGLTLSFIIIGNMIPLYGVLIFGWDIFSIFFLYWAENVIIGICILAVMFIFCARKGPLHVLGGLFTMAFFVVHYGMFCMGHLAISAELFAGDGVKYSHGSNMFLLFGQARLHEFFWAILAFAVTQLFQTWDLWKTRYSKANNIQEIMFAPYGRIVVLHIAILMGGLLAQEMGSPVWALAVLIGLKTMYDIIALRIREQHERKPEDPEKI